MAVLLTEIVTDIYHWNNTLFSFKTTRERSFRFRNGHFTMIGLPSDGKPLLRAYSFASANHDPELEFFSIKVRMGHSPRSCNYSKLETRCLLERGPTAH